jgi:tetratricopeptide (TPR) repeat protein
MECQYTLQQLSDLLDQCSRSGAGRETRSCDSPETFVGETFVGDLLVGEHVASCHDCRRRLDWLTDDPELLAAAQRGAATEQEEPAALRQAMEVVESLWTLPSQGDTIADEKQPDLSRLLDPPQDSRDLGTIGRYQAQTILGTGGMSVVFAAWDPMLQRRVAIKVFTTANDAQACKRFVREARAAARIEHQAIVPVYEVVERRGKPPALVMPLMSGGTLQQQLGRESLTSQQAAEVTARIADGLAEVHRHDQVHRDIKPGNILFDLVGQPRLGDFGLVRKHADEPLTEANVLPGTPEFVAPELLLDSSPASVASDVYQLGLTLYTMLVGVCPYQGTVTNVLRQIAEGPPPKPSKQGVVIPKDLETICLKAIERQPADRYPSAAALAEDLKRYLRGEPIAASRPSVLASTYRWCKKRPVTTAITGITVPCLLLLAVAYGAYQRQTQQSEHFQHQAQRLEKQKDEQQVRADVAELKSEQTLGQIFLGALSAQKVHEPAWVDMKEMFLGKIVIGLEQLLEQIRLDPKRKDEIGNTALGIANFRVQLNQHDQASKMFLTAIEQFDRQLSEQPTLELWQSQTQALRGFGAAANQLGKPDRAIEHLTRACEIAAEQAHNDPKSLKWQLEAALAETENGHALAALGHDQQAIKRLDDARNRFERIEESDGAHFDLHNFRLQLADGIARLAIGYQRLEQFERAVELQKLAIQQNERIGQDELSQVRQADSHAVMSEILADAGMAAEAESELRLAIQTLRQVISASGQPKQYEAKLQQWQRQAASPQG